MELMNEPMGAVDVTTTPIHLGRGSRAVAVAGFAFDPVVLQAYATAVADDGGDGRIVMLFDGRASGGEWERHPAGDEVVVCVSGRVTVLRDVAGDERRVELGPGEATVNPRGVWHVVEADDAARFVTITPGIGTEHRPR